MVRIVIVDDTARVRAALRAMLAEISGTQVVAEYEDVSDAIPGILRDRPDLVLLDLRLQTGSGLNVLRAVKQNEPAPRVFVFTNHAQPEYRELAAQAGAEEFFDKLGDAPKLVDAITRLARDMGRA